MARSDAVEQRAQHAIIFGVEVERRLQPALASSASRLPHLQAPALLGCPIDRVVAVAIEVEFEARAMGDDMWRQPRTASPVKGSSSRSRSASLKRIRCRDLGSEFVPVVNGCRDHGPRPVLNSPPAIVSCTILAHAADSVWNIVRFLRDYVGDGPLTAVS